MQLTKENLPQLADRSLGQRPLIMPYPKNFVAEQLGQPSATIQDELAFGERYNCAVAVEVYFSSLGDTAARWCEQLQWTEECAEDELLIHRQRTLRTPYGELKEQTRTHKRHGLTHRAEEMINDEDDIKALAWLIKECMRVVRLRRDDIKKAMVARIAPQANEIRGRGVSFIHFWTPITEVLGPYFSQISRLYFLHDYPKLASELMAEVMEYTYLLIEAGTEAQVDAMQTALWGYEQWSPKTYENYVIPYIKPISERTRAGGLLFWNHTCGHMKGLLEQEMYHRFGVDILECLNYPPGGDVDDWPRLRRFAPAGTITKGNLEVSLLWQGPIEEIKRKTHEILVESEGFKHILSTSDEFFDDTPLAHFEAMLEAVDEYSAERGLG